MTATATKARIRLPRVGDYLTNGTALVRVIEIGVDAVWVENALTYRERKLASGRLYRTWRVVDCEPLPLPKHLMDGG